MLPARQGGYQHDKGGLGQMEVGDKAVHPAHSFNVPSSAAQLSMVRQEVVPTQMTRPPSRLVRLMVSAVSAEIMQYSLCISWSVISSSFTGRKVPRPTWSVT